MLDMKEDRGSKLKHGGMIIRSHGICDATVTSIKQDPRIFVAEFIDEMTTTCNI